MSSSRLSGLTRRIVAINLAVLLGITSVLPLSGILGLGKANAAPATNLVVNEIFPNPGSGADEWVELYNPTGSPIDLSGWSLADLAQAPKNLTGVVPAGGFSVYSQASGWLNNSTETVTLSNGAGYTDVVSYGVINSESSYARTYDGSDTWETRTSAAVTYSSSNGLAPQPVAEAELNAEEFAAHSSSTYKGISVGFNTKNFGTVTAVSVSIQRLDGSVVTKTGNQGLFDLISNQTTTQQFTAPFVIQEGTFKEADDVLYWDPAPAEWKITTMPIKATISVTDENGTKTVVNTKFNHGSPSWPSYYGLVPPLTVKQTVSGNTTAIPTQPGWMFNRDTTTSTPFEFNNDESSLGDGSLYVPPIGSNPSDKFIAENFIYTPVIVLKDVSYDFKLAENSQPTDGKQFYLNIYANFGSSNPTKFYDCRYSVVPQSGSTTDFTTVRFDPNQAYPVTTSPTSPHTCPAVPAQMTSLSISSLVRAIAINVGDTTANDAGVSGYIDNVSVEQLAIKFVYDFEPQETTTPPGEDDEEEDDGEDDGDNGGDDDGSDNGNGGNESGGDGSGTGEVTTTVVSAVTEFDNSSATGRGADDQTVDTTADETEETTEQDTSVLAETDTENNLPTEAEEQQEQSADSSGLSIWWIILALVLAFIGYKMVRRKKSNQAEV